MANDGPFRHAHFSFMSKSDPLEAIKYVNHMQEKRILVIDDDAQLLQLVALIFTRAGSQVYTALSGSEGLRQFYDHQPDLVILDLMMPKMDGWEVCRRIRELSPVPLIILTALDQDTNIIRGLACGADDYVVKPFNPEVLLARAQAVLRRAGLPPAMDASPTYDDDYLTIDLGERRVLVQGEIVRLTATEYRLLAYLVRYANRVLSFDQILQNIWGEDYRGNTAYVHVYIRRLREKLEVDPRNPTYLLTEYGIGYQFEKRSPGQTAH
jgi:DNA-binding response OmpR family regulator